MRPIHRFPLFVLLPFALLLGACEDEPEVYAPEEPPPATVAEIQPITTAEVHDAICGCQLADVKRCGNYVELGGRHVEIAWPELGKMEWCKDGEKGARVEITGAMKDGKFVADSYRRVE